MDIKLANGLLVAATLAARAAIAAVTPPVGLTTGALETPIHISVPASEQSVKDLLQITEMHRLLDRYLDDVDSRVAAELQRSVAGRNLNSAQEAIMARARDNISTILKDAITWESMEPMAIRAYREALTQEELDGMIAFYKTPAGEAVIKKMPQLSQAMSNEIQRLMQTVMPKLLAIQKRNEDDMKLATPMFDAHPSAAVRASSAPPSTTVPCVVPGIFPSPPNK